MPDEFRIWREKVQAASVKVSDLAQRVAAATSGGGSNGTHGSNSLGVSRDGTSPDAVSGKPALTKSAARQQQQLQQSSDSNMVVDKVVYGNRAEARDAFTRLLTSFGISSTHKMKDVQELCQADPGWEALTKWLSPGEKKQELAEYQVITSLGYIIYVCT